MVHKAVAQPFLEKLQAQLGDKVEYVADASAMPLLEGAPKLRAAAEGDFDTEWLAYILGVKVVESVDEAIAHMREHNASHSDAIMTNDLMSAEKLSMQQDQQLFM